MTSTTNEASQVTSNTTATATSSIRQSRTCSSCRISFDDDDGQAQRKHMKSPWHVYNLKRRIASLPPIPQDVFNAQVQPIQPIQPTPEHVADSSTRRTAEHIERDVAIRHQCLFCHQKFDDEGQGLEDAIEHMSVVHGFFVPDITLVLDLESFLGYLATAVREWHECFYCGIVRDSTTAIQSHMRDKEHCKLNLDREPELLEFWEERSEGVSIVPVKASSSALVVSSGRPGVSRASQHRQAEAARSRGRTVALRTDTTTPQDPPRPPEKPTCRQLARRDEMGIQNVGPQQRKALALAVARSQKEESIALRASEWSHATKANKQKYDQAHGPLSWAKGGLHNLLPR